jgi:AraC family transcriptional activator of pobA
MHCNMENGSKKIKVFETILDFVNCYYPNSKLYNPDFVCSPYKPTNSNAITYGGYFKSNFYTIYIAKNVGDKKVVYDGIDIKKNECFLLFRSPWLPYPFSVNDPFVSYVMMFDPKVFSFFKPSLEKEFVFFGYYKMHLIKITPECFNSLELLMQSVNKYSRVKNIKSQKQAYVKALVMFYELEEIISSSKRIENQEISYQELIFKKYISYVNEFFMEKRTIEDYAKIFNLSPLYFSKIIKLASKKSASFYINERILKEIILLMKYSNLNFSQIANQLNFTDSSHLSKFFKKNMGITLSEYQKNIQI